MALRRSQFETGLRAPPAAMPVELRLSDERARSNLLDFFQRNGLRALLDGDRIVVESRYRSPDRQLVEVTLLVQIWQIVNPEFSIELEPGED